MIFNQFEEFGNYLWHYDITGHALEEFVRTVAGPRDTYQGLFLPPVPLVRSPVEIT